MSVIYCPECGDMFEREFGIFLIVKPEITCCSTKCLETYHKLVIAKTYHEIPKPATI